MKLKSHLSMRTITRVANRILFFSCRVRRFIYKFRIYQDFATNAGGGEKGCFLFFMKETKNDRSSNQKIFYAESALLTFTTFNLNWKIVFITTVAVFYSDLFECARQVYGDGLRFFLSLKQIVSGEMWNGKCSVEYFLFIFCSAASLPALKFSIKVIK